MKRIILFLLILLSFGHTHAQKIDGQWRGYFDDNGNIGINNGGNTEYILELEIDGSSVTGYSYSYFSNRKYYVICSLKGTYNKSTKSLKVIETARIKGYTPLDWTDCLQIHNLKYQKEDNIEKLVGTWAMAPGQRGNCGSGATVLTRKTMSKNLPNYNKGKSNTAPESTTPITKVSPSDKPKDKSNVPSVKTVPTDNTAPKNVKPTEDAKNTIPPVADKKPEEKKITDEKKDASIDISKRDTKVLKTIEIERETFKVDLYDNGEIDGDTISLFYNGRLLLSHKKLTDKPITLTLNATDAKDINELTMYAENLGSIPPNTALMIVTDGDNRYEVRISSDLQKSGTIRFIHKPK